MEHRRVRAKRRADPHILHHHHSLCNRHIKNMKPTKAALLISVAISHAFHASSFAFPTSAQRALTCRTAALKSSESNQDGFHATNMELTTSPSTTITRRSILQRTILSATAAITVPRTAKAAVGTLPEFSDTNAIFQSITIDVTDKKQYEDTISFFLNGFDGCKVLRERGGDGGGVVKETVSV
jgi:hypothetical protein